MKQGLFGRIWYVLRPHGLFGRQSRAFTLIELLVVIAIIAILISILMPVMGSATQQAKKTRANADVRSLVVAWKAYYNEYGKWPVQSGTFLSGTAYAQAATEGVCKGLLTTSLVIRLLAPDVKFSLPGDKYLHDQYNQKSIVFLTSSRDSMDESGHWLKDPWGHAYRFLFDLDNDGHVSCTLAGYTTNVYDSVIAWSAGPDGSDDTEATLGDNINSWE